MSRRRIAWWSAALFWFLFGLITGIQVWISMLEHHHSVPRLLGYYVLIWEGWLLPTAAIFWLSRRFPVIPVRARNLLVHVVAAAVIAAVHVLYWIALMLVLRPFDRMTAPPSAVSVSAWFLSRSPLELILYCLVLGASIAINLYDRSANLEASLADARLHALELQLQPHFLFNTMNAIASLVRSRRNDEAVTMIAGLSDLLRYTLDHAGQQHVALEDELAVLRRYLEIQHSRFPDRMSFAIDLAPEARRAAIPTLLLQPLAENAVRHGIALSATPGVVEVRAFRSGGRLNVEVFNSGVLGTPSNGIGVRNTQARLRHLYGDEARFDLANADGGVRASLSIPWSEVA
jgi:two-component system, LytTR family, sensor kinase